MKYLRATSFVFIVSLVFLWIASGTVQAQERANEEPRTSPNATVSQTIGTTPITITYGRPHVNDRAIFGELVPYDQIWRTGANEATTITFPEPVTVEGQPLDAGTYSLFTIPGESEWTIVFNDIAQQWGAFDYDQSEDVLRVTVEPENAPHQEMMTFGFEEVTDTSAEIVLHWSEVRVPFTVSLASSGN
jgi:hypothetical protein